MTQVGRLPALRLQAAVVEDLELLTHAAPGQQLPAGGAREGLEDARDRGDAIDDSEGAVGAARARGPLEEQVGALGVQVRHLHLGPDAAPIFERDLQDEFRDEVFFLGHIHRRDGHSAAAGDVKFLDRRWPPFRAWG